MNQIFLRMLVAVVVPVFAVKAWDVEHDEVAQLTGDFLPTEIKSTMTFADYGILMESCHYPDMLEYPVDGKRRYRTLDELGAWVGPHDKEIFKEHGYTSSGWLHREHGKALVMGLLARAFAEGASARAAFYISVMTHQVSDESALNHPPVLQFVQYSRFPGVDYRQRKVEEGAKNLFGFRSDGYIVKRVREKLRGYKPVVPCEDFADCVMHFNVDVVRQADYAARHEVTIGYGPLPAAQEELADLVAMQVRTLENMIWTCWTFRSREASLPSADFDRRCAVRQEEELRTLDPAQQEVFAGLFDASLDPRSPRGAVGIVCEPYGMFATSETPYVSRMLGAMCARSLRRLGYAVKGLSFFDVSRNGLPDPKELPCLLFFTGGSGYMCRDVDAGAVAAVRAYRERGGTLILVGGADKNDLSGFASAMTIRSNREVPVTAKWAHEEEGDCRKMALVVEGMRHPFVRNPNFDGFCKPVCSVTVDPVKAPGISVLASLDNGRDVRAIAVRKGLVAWMPAYALMPYLFVKDDPHLDYAAPALDPFGENFLRRVVDSLDAARVAARGVHPAK